MAQIVGKTMDLYDIEMYMADLVTAAEHTIDIALLNGKRVMITGASGTIGSFIVDMLMAYNDVKDGNIGVVACGRSPERLKARFSKWSESKNLEFARLDVLDEDLTELYPGNIDYCIHAAGNAYPSAFVGQFEDTVKGNILGTDALMRFAAKHGCSRFVYVSSGEVYSVSDEDKIRLEVIFKEYSASFKDYCREVLKLVSEKGPRSSYPISKWATEKMCLENRLGLCCNVVRPCHTFGPGITGNDDRAHVQFALKAAKGETIVLNSAGTQLRSYNYVADASSAIISVMTCSKAGTCMDICSPDNVITIRDLAELMGKAAGVSVVVKEPDERQKSLLSPINKQVLDSSALSELGWKKAFDLERGTEHFVKIVEGIYS
jgi:nucleoside-diphosphate-sugar epimerase